MLDVLIVIVMLAVLFTVLSFVSGRNRSDQDAGLPHRPLEPDPRRPPHPRGHR